jgi:hypothetical protein
MCLKQLQIMVKHLLFGHVITLMQLLVVDVAEVVRHVGRPGPSSESALLAILDTSACPRWWPVAQDRQTSAGPTRMGRSPLAIQQPSGWPRWRAMPGAIGRGQPPAKLGQHTVSQPILNPVEPAPGSSGGTLNKTRGSTFWQRVALCSG